MNKVILVGRLTRDPEVRFSQGGTAIARFSVAVDRRRANEDGTRSADFPDCTAFGKQAEFAEKYLRKGSRIALSGRLQTGSYTRQDGSKAYTTDVIAEDIEFAESKAEADSRGGQAAQPQGYAQPQGGYNGYRQPAPVYGQPQGGYGQAAQQPQGNYNAYRQPAAGHAQPQQGYQQPAGQYQQPQPPADPAQASASAPGGMPEGFMGLPDDAEQQGLPWS